ncbi:MAG TPA: ATP-binding cassette domain-containing protein [Bryobacteraceae bacterium]|nr:ATP-binding cassette domain-containing protein [Bryobacteraceae bacterium]
MPFERPALIEFEHVWVMRGEKVVLRDLSLRIGAGEHVAILGPNGCGKSTLIKTIVRECYPLVRTGSRMAIFGQERWNIFDLRPLLGVVSNDWMALCTREITGREAVVSGFFGSVGVQPYHVITPEIERKTGEILALLEIPHLAERAVIEMSSGEARRVLLARALVHGPRALILDEPSNSLDVFAQHELREIMRKLARAGIGIILVTHHLADIIPEIERVILMREGRIVADGRKLDVLTATALADLFGLPVDLSRRDGYFHLG